MPADKRVLAVAADILAAQPFNQMMGATIHRFEDGEAILELEIADRHLQQYGVVHGGVLECLVDNALTFACGTVLGTSIITNGLSVTYLAAARTGRLRATAEVTAHDQRRAVATVVVDCTSSDGTVRVCATDQGTAVATRSEAA